MARGIERRVIVHEDQDRAAFLERLAGLPERFGVVIHAYALMDNHYHLLLETPRANLSQAMQWLNVSYSVWFNRRRGRVGPLFAGRFRAQPVEADAHLLEVSRYVHLNVVRTRVYGLAKSAQAGRRVGIGVAPTAAQIAERLRKLRGYRWSSYRSYLGLARVCDWLQCARVRALLGGRTVEEQREGYRRFVEEAIREGIAEDEWQRLERGVVIGGGAFVERMRALVSGEPLQQPELRWFGRKRGFGQIQRAVERVKGEPWERFADRYGDWGRDLGLWLGRTKCGLSLKELAQHAGLSNYRSLATVIRNFEKRMQADKKIRIASKQAATFMTYET
jgi:REP element-mobilizing transposase RayT